MKFFEEGKTLLQPASNVIWASVTWLQLRPVRGYESALSFLKRAGCLYYFEY